MPDKRRPGVFRDDDERAEVGREHRERARNQPGPADEPDATPTTEAASDEVTSPIALAQRDLSVEERAFVVLLGGDPDDPGQLGMIAKLATRVNAVKVDERRDNRARANEHLELTGQGSLADRVGRIERLIKWLGGLALTALLAGAGSLVAVGKGLYERGEQAGGDAIRLQTLERDVQQLRLDLRDVRYRNDRSGWLVPPLAPTTRSTP